MMMTVLIVLIHLCSGHDDDCCDYHCYVLHSYCDYHCYCDGDCHGDCHGDCDGDGVLHSYDDDYCCDYHCDDEIL
jgi:hypothetical protein